MKQLVVAIFCVFIIGCGQLAPVDRHKNETPMLNEIKSVIASHLGMSADEIAPTATFADLGADDLDLVEITMEVEDQLNLVIRDDALVAKTGSASANDLCRRLTVQGFAEVASAAPPPVAPDAPHPDSPESGVLRESQVGTYEQLIALPNPENLELVFIPNFDDVRRFKEEEAGRALADSEIDAIRASSVVIALTPAMAAKMRQRDSELQP
jgi:acyl carrier protein